MTEPLPDTWHNRDLPVLRTVVRLCDANGGKPVAGSAVKDVLGIEQLELRTAITALASDGLLTSKGRTTSPTDWIGAVTGEARRRAGAWPTADTGADRLLAALNHLAETTNDEDERTRLRRIIDGFAGSGRQVAVSVASAIITGQVS